MTDTRRVPSDIPDPAMSTQAGRIDRALTWTAQMPTVPGVYWFRSQNYSARIVEVSHEAETGGLIWTDCETTWDWVDRTYTRNEWAGPIQKPEEGA